MIRHDAISEEFETFALFAELQAFYYGIPVFPSGKYIYPINSREGNKVRIVCAPDLIIVLIADICQKIKL
jgi:hypothetical protein